MSEHKKVINVNMKSVAGTVQATPCNININHYNFDKVSEDFLDSNETYRGYAIAPVKVDLSQCHSFELETVWTSRQNQMLNNPFVFGGRYSSYGWPHLYQSSRGSNSFYLRIPSTSNTYYVSNYLDTNNIEVVPNRRYHFWFGQNDGDYVVYNKDQQGNIIGAKDNLFIYQNYSSSSGYYGIDTGITVSPDLRIETKFKYDTSDSWRRLFGRTVDTSGINDVSLDFSHDGFNFYYSADDNQGNFRSITSFNTNVNTLVMDVKNNKIVLNGTEYAMNHSITKESSKTMGLFNCQYNDYPNIQDSSCFYGRVYYWRAYKNDVLVANFIPVYTDMKIGNIIVTTPCFYDTVSKTFKVNLNSSYGFTFNYDAFQDFLFYLDASWSDYNELTGEWDQWNTRRRVWSWSPKTVNTGENPTVHVRTRTPDPLVFMQGFELNDNYFNRGSLGLKDTKLTIDGQVVWQAYKEFSVGDEVYLNHGMAKSSYEFEANHPIDCYKTGFTWKGIVNSITTDQSGQTVLTIAPMPNESLEKTMTVSADNAVINSYGEKNTIDSDVTITSDQNNSTIKTSTLIDDYGMGGYTNQCQLFVKPLEGCTTKIIVEGKQYSASNDYILVKRGSISSIIVTNDTTGKIVYSFNDFIKGEKYFVQNNCDFSVYTLNEQTGEWELDNNHELYINDALVSRAVGYPGQTVKYRVEKDGYQIARGNYTFPEGKDNKANYRSNIEYNWETIIKLDKLETVEVQGTVEGANVVLYNNREHKELNDTIKYVKGTKILDGDNLQESNCYENGEYYYNIPDPVPPVPQPSRVTYTSTLSGIAGKRYYAYNNDNQNLYTSDLDFYPSSYFKLDNLNKVNNVNITDDGIASGFNDSNHLEVTAQLDNSIDFEIQFKVRVPTSWNTDFAGFFQYKEGIFCGFYKGDGPIKFHYNQGNTYSWTSGYVGSHQYTSGEIIYIKIVKENGVVSNYCRSSVEDNWELDGSYTPNYFASFYPWIGDRSNSDDYFTGEIYLPECYMINNGITTNFGHLVNPSIMYDSNLIALDPQPTMVKDGLNSFYISDKRYLRNPNADLIDLIEESGESGEINRETPFTIETEKLVFDEELLPSLEYSNLDEDYIHHFLYWSYNNERVNTNDRVIDELILNAKWLTKSYDCKETWESFYPFTDHDIAPYLSQLDPTKFAVNEDMQAITNVNHDVSHNYIVNDSFEITPDYNCTLQIDLKLNCAPYHYGRVRIDESWMIPSIWDFNRGSSSSQNDSNVTTISKDLMAGKTYYVHLQWQVDSNYGPYYGESLSIKRIALIVKDIWKYSRLIPDLYQSSYPDGRDNPISGYKLTATYGNPESSTSSSGEFLYALVDTPIAPGYNRWQKDSNAARPYAGQIYSENTVFKLKYYTVNKYAENGGITERVCNGWNIYVSDNQVDFTDSNWRNNCSLVDTRVNQFNGEEAQEYTKYYEIPDINKNILAKSIIFEVTSDIGDTNYTDVGQLRFYGDFITNTGTKTITYTSEIPAGVGEKYEAYTYDEESGEPGPIIPEGYTRIEYIQGTGQQYIDLGFNATINSKVQLKINPQYIDESAILGQSWALDGFFLMFYSNYIRWHSADAVDVSVSLNTDYEIEVSNGNLKVNGTSYSCTPSSSLVSSSSINIFRTPGYSWDILGKFKLSYLKWYEGNILTMDLIPVVRDLDLVPGVYDIVSDTFFSSATSTQFIAGPIIY